MWFLFILNTLMYLTFGCVRSARTADEYMDNIIVSTLQEEIEGLRLDPLHLPNFTTTFTDHVRIIGDIRGSARFTDGLLTGLSKVEREGNCTGPDYLHGAYVIGCTIVLNHLSAVHRGKMKYSILPAIPVKAKSNMTKTSISVEVASYLHDPQPVLQFYNIKKYGVLYNTFSGLGPLLNKYLIILDSGYREKMEVLYQSAVTQSFQYALSRAISATVASSPVMCYEGYEPCV